MSQRMAKINELLRRELSVLIQDETRGRFVTVTGVKTSPDLRDAQVWISILNTQDEGILAEIAEKQGEFRHILGKRLDLKYIPRLTFHLDRSSATAARVDKILDEERSKGGL